MERHVIVKKEKVDSSNSVSSTTTKFASKLQVSIKQEIVTLFIYSSDASDVYDGHQNVGGSKTVQLERQVIAKQEKAEIPAVETKSNEMPSFKVQRVQKYPDQIVENASLASVSLPDAWYKLVLPEEIIDSGAL